MTVYIGSQYQKFWSNLMERRHGSKSMRQMPHLVARQKTDLGRVSCFHERGLCFKGLKQPLNCKVEIGTDSQTLSLCKP